MSTQTYTTNPGTTNQQVTSPSRRRRWVLAVGAAVMQLSGAAAAVGAIALGGGSNGPLRPQPPSASKAALTRMMAQPKAAGRLKRVTMKSPMRAAPYKDCPDLARAG